jgi:hypothetical protein
MKFMASMLAASLAVSASALASFAESETTTTTTTVETTATPSYVLPNGSTYVVIDPASGSLLGQYDPVKRYIIDGNRPLTAGAYVVEQSSGRVFATADSSGNLVSFTAVPTVVPQNFVIMNNQLVYANSFELRRAQIDGQIASQYAAGRLTNHQVKELRQDLAQIAALETHRKGDGTYSSSRTREIERKFADVQSDLNKYIADTNGKRARIGIRAD